MYTLYSCFVRPCARRTVRRVSFSLDSFIGQGAISIGVRKPGSPPLKRYSCVRRRTLRVRRYYYYNNSPYRIIARAFADNIISTVRVVCRWKYLWKIRRTPGMILFSADECEVLVRSG